MAGNDDDTYEQAKVAGEAQIVKEQVMRSDILAQEEDALGIWDDFMLLPYGNKYDIRVRTDLSISEHNRLMKILDNVPDEVEDEANPFTDALVILTLGLYTGDQLIQQTDVEFWDNPKNWSTLKIQQILRGYLQNYKQEMGKTTTFLEEPARESKDDSTSSISK